MPQRCAGSTKKGTPCRGWAVPGTTPPRCAAHARAVGAPPNNRNALTHGAYAAPLDPPQTIEDALTHLSYNLSTLAGYINTHLIDLQADEAYQLLALQGQNLSRFSRMLRDQRALSGEAADGIAGAIAQALDELATELGTEL